jgi:hypothetical protein
MLCSEEIGFLELEINSEDWRNSRRFFVSSCCLKVRELFPTMHGHTLSMELQNVNFCTKYFITQSEM